MMRRRSPDFARPSWTRYDGIFLLRTNARVTPPNAVLRYRELLLVESLFRAAKSPALAWGSGVGEPADLDRRPVVLRAPEIVLHLLRQPAFGAAAEGLGQPDRHLR